MYSHIENIANLSFHKFDPFARALLDIEKALHFLGAGNNNKKASILARNVLFK